LTEEQLIEVCLGDTTDVELPGQSAHLEHCGECQARHSEFVSLLADASRAATAATDAAFSDERLTRQRDAIMERVALASSSGRLITFPAGPARPAVPAGPTTGSRWVAAAAAAGLVIGLLGGHLSHDLTQPSTAMRANATAIAQAVPRGLAEDELLGLLETALEETGPSALRPLDALTPVAWDIRD
jgi:anti-sigma factor RsiW